MASKGDWKNITDEKKKYAAYLCSREWCEKREAVRSRANNMCERCRLYKMDACHHLTYERKFNELLEDLQAICKGCHEFTHGKSNIDPMTHKPFGRYVASVARDYGEKRRPVGFEFVMDLFTEVHAMPAASSVMLLVEQSRRAASVSYSMVVTGEAEEDNEAISEGFMKCAQLIQDTYLTIALIEWFNFGCPAGIGYDEYVNILESHGYTFPVPERVLT